ncbi:MAG: hypothetical protein ACLQUY_22805 [Ktedonobacterales bacterium]
MLGECDPDIAQPAATTPHSAGSRAEFIEFLPVRPQYADHLLVERLHAGDGVLRGAMRRQEADETNALDARSWASGTVGVR